MSKHILLLTLIIFLTQATLPNDQVECFRMKDSSYGHFTSCSATKPLPLKVESTFTLDKDYTWTIFSYDVALYDGVSKQTTSLSKCIQGSPGVGNKTAGSNLTLATTCNVLPRQLKQYDMVRYEVHFPNTQWLIWSVPIPGYTTYQDIQRFAQDPQFFNPIIKTSQQSVNGQNLRVTLKRLTQNLKGLKNIHKN